MSTTVQQLINSGQKLVTILREDTAQNALKLMIEHNYSQLPVVERDGKVLEEKGKAYMITSDSILRTLSHFGTNINDSQLRVADAMIKTSIFREDSDLFDLLNDLQDTYAVLIVNDKHEPLGVVTSYDATDYFRQRVEDIMLVEDIEEALKKYILAAYPMQEEKTNHELIKIIDNITPSNRDLQGNFQKALQYYLNNAGLNATPLQKELANRAFEEHIYRKENGKAFDRLTLNQYIEVFLHKNRWDRFKSIFSLDSKNIRQLLYNVRDIRNNLAHFRNTVSKQQHDVLFTCKEWLERHEKDVLKEFELKQLSTSARVTYIIAESSNEEISPVEEAIRPNESRYAPLALILQEQPRSQTQIQLTFQEIEELIKGTLPPSARQHRSWWANDSVGHVQSQQWLDVGWRVSRINMSEETITFTRDQEREKAYIDFFSGLIQCMRENTLTSKRDLSPDGSSWITFTWITELSVPIAALAFSFARYGRFRVELYIDTREREKNKRIFDELYSRKEAIQTELGDLAEALEWERIGEKRASRIALYHVGSITNKKETLTNLQKWAVEAMKRFQIVMEKHVTEIIVNKPNLASPKTPFF